MKLGTTVSTSTLVAHKLYIEMPSQTRSRPSRRGGRILINYWDVILRCIRSSVHLDIHSIEMQTILLV